MQLETPTLNKIKIVFQIEDVRLKNVSWKSNAGRRDALGSYGDKSKCSGQKRKRLNHNNVNLICLTEGSTESAFHAETIT